MSSLPDPSPEEPSKASRVGPYTLLALIGEGGMGVVHLAQGPDGKRIALKVLRPHVVGDAEARERLAREVSSLRRITSPRIAEILDADAHGPVPYVVTRYVPGLSLYHHVAEEGPIAGADLLHFADCLAEALQAVHSVGVLHRDVKPTNVLMEGRSPVLIDFGLARVAEDPRLTQTGWLLGTPGYLAPEILYGDDASPASDVHAWAATVVFAATGRPPYGKGPAMAIMDRVRRGEHDLSGVEEPLRGLLRQALSPEPLERPSLVEVRGFVRGARQGAPTPRVASPAPELWTMPFQPAPLPETARTTAVPLEPSVPDAGGEAAAAQVAAPPAGLLGGLPIREATPYQQPMPPTRVVPAMPTQSGDLGRPLAPTPRDPSRAQQVLQLLGLGALTVATVAYAPYLGAGLVGLVALLLRTASVTRQRHGRRQLVRGRARWYDVPTTTLSTQGYAVLALFGAVALVAVAGLVWLALFSLGYLLSQPAVPTLVFAGLGFTVALWWGPGSGRMREMVRGLTTRTARTEFGGWFVVAMSLLGSAVLLGLLLSSGANWSPALTAPWQ
ncbi:MAG: serine/threonine-protein kinase [Marmoricola sp.]